MVQTETLGRGAKLLAVCLCDTFVRRKSGRSWPKDDTIASRMGVKKEQFNGTSRRCGTVVGYGVLKFRACDAPLRSLSQAILSLLAKMTKLSLKSQ